MTKTIMFLYSLFIHSFIYFGQIISAIKIIMYIVGHDKLTHQIWYEFEPVKVANQEKIGSVSRPK